MAGSVNKVILIGNLGKDPEVRTFENGGSVASFSVATTDSYWDKEKNQRIDLPTDWHNVRINRPGLIKLAQQYLRKGSQVYLEGRIKNRQYQSKEGETKYITEIVVDELVLTGKAPAGGAAQADPQGESQSPPPESYSTPNETDNLPF